ncbi:hypothetical protein [Streptomyces sp. C]|uniref:hypothetical protein n=1 Tax=Streptomyces sp. C TaxID=253839 RepID=UPI001F505913|nr:hypothetical protein [Streptomyces sp. C]
MTKKNASTRRSSSSDSRATSSPVGRCHWSTQRSSSVAPARSWATTFARSAKPEYVMPLTTREAV